MLLFWSRGYDAVAIADLEEATGLNRSSLYNAFGPKDEIYREALTRYSSRVLRTVLPPLEQSDLAQAVGEMMRGYRQFLQNPHSPGGCLMALASYETGPAGVVAASVLQDTIMAARRAVTARFETEVQANRITAEHAQDLVSLTLSTLSGIATLSRLKAPDRDFDLLIGALSRAIAEKTIEATKAPRLDVAREAPGTSGK